MLGWHALIWYFPLTLLIIDSFIDITDLSTTAGVTNCCKQQIGKSTGVSFSCCLPPACASVFPSHTWKYFVVFPPVNIAFNLEIYNWDLEFTLPEYFNKAYSCTIFSGNDWLATSSDSICFVFHIWSLGRWEAIYHLKWECKSSFDQNPIFCISIKYTFSK